MNMDSSPKANIYSNIKSHFEEGIHELQLTGQDINMDALFLHLFFHCKTEMINSEIFIRTLFEVIKDMDLPLKQIDIEELKDYLMHRVLDIKDIQFWEKDEEELLRCNLLVSGKCMIVKGEKSVWKIYAHEEGPVSIQISTYDNRPSMFFVNVGNQIFIMNTSDKNRLIDYFNQINEEFSQDIKQIVAMINEETQNAPSDLIRLVHNFLSIIPLSILLDRDGYVAFEHLISYNSYVAQQVVDSSAEQRNDIVELFKRDTRFHEEINNFVKGDFSKLIKIAHKHVSVPERYFTLVIWKLIRKEANQFFYRRWKDEHGSHFEDDDQRLNLDEYVDIYCKCHDILHKNIVNVGLFTYYLMNKDSVFPVKVNGDFLQCNAILTNKILKRTEDYELECFEDRLSKAQLHKNKRYSINDIDLLDGYEFEQLISLLFTEMGYVADITKGSGDQGADIIAEKDNNRIGIQAKCHSNPVTNTAVQEITASLNYYNCNKGMVITNNYFTKSAIELAQSNNIILWDRDILKIKIDELLN